METQTASTASLIPYERNNRQHSQQQVDRIANSIAEFGFNQPIVVDENNIVLVGHGRLEAAKKLGLAEVPVVRKSGLTETQKKAYRILDNKLQNDSTWDAESLNLELAALEDADFDLAAWGLDEFAKLFPEEKTAEEDGFEPREVKETIIKLGDLLELGDHRLLCGDSTKAEDVARLMGGAKAHMVFTDPPYNCGAVMSESLYAGTNSSAMKGLASAAWDKNFPIEQFLIVLTEWVPVDGSVYICTSHMLAPSIWSWMEKAEANLHGYLVWVKRNPMPSLTKRQPTWATELICYATFGKHTFNFPDSGHCLSWWDITTNAANTFHPTQKPVEVPSRAVGLSSCVGDIVLDPFLGSGTTLIAADQLGRKCYGMEISPQYCQVIVDRYKAHCDKSGKPFECRLNGEDVSGYISKPDHVADADTVIA